MCNSSQKIQLYFFDFSHCWKLIIERKVIVLTAKKCWFYSQFCLFSNYIVSLSKKDETKLIWIRKIRKQFWTWIKIWNFWTSAITNQGNGVHFGKENFVSLLKANCQPFFLFVGTFIVNSWGHRVPFIKGLHTNPVIRAVRLVNYTLCIYVGGRHKTSEVVLS